ncbi:hypothetical protein Bca101_071578 [Brassica carinata]
MICVREGGVRRRYRRISGENRRREEKSRAEEEERNGEEEGARGYKTKASSSEFPRNFVKSPNGSPTAIIFPRNSSVFSEEPIFPRNFLGIFRRIDISSEFRRYIPRKFRRNPILCFLGISSEIPRDILRISFSVGMSVRIPLFSCSGSSQKSSME